jgi:4-hydroxy-tetrahydrodipicolinate synthase
MTAMPNSGSRRPPSPWGSVMTAMVTPFASDGALDVDAASRLATHLVERGNEGIVVAGTTGEAPTLTDDEHSRLVQAVVEAVGMQATILAGVGTNDTAHTVQLASAAAKAGAAGLLVVTPYYSKPPQAGILAHFLATADATDLPVMLYDIPGRTGVKLGPDTLRRAAEHPRIVAVKDAAGDLFAGAELLRDTDLHIYSGDDALNLPWLALGATGIVSVVSHLAPAMFAELVHAARAGDLRRSAELNTELLSLISVVMTRTQGAIMAKAGLVQQGVLRNGTVRPPLTDAPAGLIDDLRRELKSLLGLDSGMSEQTSG